MLSAQTKKPFHPSSVHRVVVVVVVVVHVSRRKSSKALLKKPPDPLFFKQKKGHDDRDPSSLERTLALATRFIRIDRLLEPLLTLARLGTGTERHLCRRFRSSRSPQPNALDCVCVGRNVSLYRVEAGGAKKRRVERGDEETRKGSLAFAVGVRRTCARVDESRVE